jgi:hypothetical protein
MKEATISSSGHAISIASSEGRAAATENSSIALDLLHRNIAAELPLSLIVVVLSELLASAIVIRSGRSLASVAV